MKAALNHAFDSESVPSNDAWGALAGAKASSR
jgi:hypothetical protein